MQYRDGDLVLKEVSFHAPPGTRVSQTRLIFRRLVFVANTAAAARSVFAGEVELASPA